MECLVFISSDVINMVVEMMYATRSIRGQESLYNLQTKMVRSPEFHSPGVLE